MLKVTKHIQDRAPNRSMLLRSDPWPPADERFLLLNTPCPASWRLLEVFHMHGVWQGTGMGLDAAVGSPKEELEHLSHWDTEPCAATGGPPQ